MCLGRRSRPSYSNNMHKSSSSSSTTSLVKQPILSHILRDLAVPSWIVPSGFLFFGFRKSNFLTLQSRQPCVNPPPQPGGSCLYIYVPQWQGWRVIPQTPGSLFFALHESQDYGGGILTCLHSGQDAQIVNIKSRPLHSTQNYTSPIHMKILSVLIE
jgi:hypothetical protein